jgi:hypothetical protein
MKEISSVQLFGNPNRIRLKNAEAGKNSFLGDDQGFGANSDPQLFDFSGPSFRPRKSLIKTPRKIITPQSSNAQDDLFAILPIRNPLGGEGSSAIVTQHIHCAHDWGATEEDLLWCCVRCGDIHA